MGYEGESILDVVDRLEEVSKRTGHRLADAMTDHGKDQIRLNTPVETFHLWNSYKRTQVKYRQQATAGYVSISWSLWVWEASVYTEVEYAPYVEFGTGLWGPKRKKYKIEPKKPGGVLAFTPYERTPKGGVILDITGAPKKGGGLITVRYVMHPGSPGQHMFKIGASLTEDEYSEWSKEPMRLWKQGVEGI